MGRSFFRDEEDNTDLSDSTFASPPSAATSLTGSYTNSPPVGTPTSKPSGTFVNKESINPDDGKPVSSSSGEGGGENSKSATPTAKSSDVNGGIISSPPASLAPLATTSAPSSSNLGTSGFPGGVVQLPYDSVRPPVNEFVDSTEPRLSVPPRAQGARASGAGMAAAPLGEIPRSYDIPGDYYSSTGLTPRFAPHFQPYVMSGVYPNAQSSQRSGQYDGIGFGQEYSMEAERMYPQFGADVPVAGAGGMTITGPVPISSETDPDDGPTYAVGPEVSIPGPSHHRFAGPDSLSERSHEGMDGTHGEVRGEPVRVSRTTPTASPVTVDTDNDGIVWIQFEYTRNRVRWMYRIRCDIERVTENDLTLEFMTENCIYPRAMVPPEQYTGHRQRYETQCNQLGWRLSYLNPELQTRRGLIQRAVDSYRNSSADSSVRSRRVRRLDRQRYPRNY